MKARAKTDAAQRELDILNYCTSDERFESYLNDGSKAILIRGDCQDVLRRIPRESVDCVITSPPYWNQRDYQIGLGEQQRLLGNEESHHDYVKNLAGIFSEVKRVLKKEGSLWLNLGDKYVNKKPDGASVARGNSLTG